MSGIGNDSAVGSDFSEPNIAPSVERPGSWQTWELEEVHSCVALLAELLDFMASRSSPHADTYVGALLAQMDAAQTTIETGTKRRGIDSF